MDTLTWLSIAAIFIILVITVYFLNGSAKRQEKKLKKSLSYLALQNQGEITEMESWTHRIVGIDRNQRHLYYKNVYLGDPQEFHVSLEHIKRVEILEGKSGRKIQLEIFLKKENTESLTISMFNPEIDAVSHLEEAEKRARKWKTLIENSRN